MNILKIQYFIDVADNLSFTKAAQKNFVSQTAVSQQIAAVERELDTQLFIREKGRVTLTPAGEAFYQDCKRILTQYNKAVARAKRIQAENGGVITLGFLTACKMGYLSDVIREFQKKYANINIRLRQCSFEEIRQLLEFKEIDIALTSIYTVSDIEHIEVEEVARRKMGLLVSKENPLAQYNEISAKQVEEQDIIMTSTKFAGRIYEYMMNQRQIEGFEPKIVETADSSEILVMLVELNRGACFLPEKTAVYNRSLCKMLHIMDNDDYLDLSIAWQKESDNHMALMHFVQCLREFFYNDYADWEEANK